MLENAKNIKVSLKKSAKANSMVEDKSSERVYSSSIQKLRNELDKKDKEIAQLKEKLENEQQFFTLKSAVGQLQDFLLMSPVPIYFKDKTLKYSFANLAFAALANLPVEDLLGISNKELQIGKYIQQLEDLETEVLKTNEAIRDQEIRFMIDDEPMLIKAFVFPMLNQEGAIDGLMVCCIDLSDKLQYASALSAAQEKAKLGVESKQAFLANLSHEIRTPLHGILGSTSLLKTLLNKDQELELLENIQLSGASLLEMVDSMLLLESLDKGEWAIKKEPFNLRELVEEISTKYQEQAKLKFLDLQFFIAQGLPNILVGDAEKIKMVLNIFLSNAIKFTDKGFVHLFVQADEHKENSIAVKFTIKDTGIGVKTDLQPELFTSFTQGDSSITKSYQGTGIGLAMAEKTIAYFGGSVGFSSAEFTGSTFWFIIDIDKEEIGSEIVSKISPADLPVLLVEDNKINQKIAFFTLKKLGFEVEIAENGFDAVERFENGDYKIVLMDLQMPIMNGFDATVKIRSFEKQKGKSSSLIIALSANTIKEDVQKCFMVGMNEYISKPFSPDKLIEIIQKHIDIES